MTPPIHELEAFFAGTADADQLRAIEAWLQADPANAKAFMQQLQFRELLGDHLREQADSTASVLAEFAQLESQVVEEALPPIHLNAEALTKDKYLSALSYVVRHTFTPKRMALLATAAVLLLGLVVAITMLTGNDGDIPVAINPDGPNEPATEPGPVGPAPTSIVATLTAERDVVWKQPGGDVHPGALRQGTPLSAGQRLELSQGFAEITTIDGAIAIIQAPATIELLDNSNAIRLHAGKLVGICEIESSKGFIVRTPHLDITDLGTRFSVDTTEQTRTTVQVFDGEVQVAQADRGTSGQRPTRLTAGQAMAGNSKSLSRTGFEVKPFVDAFNFSAGRQDLRPHFQGSPVLWRGMVRQGMMLHEKEADGLQVFVERQAVMFQTELPVDTKPGETWPHERGFGKATISPASPVDVYLLHLDPIGDRFGRDIRVQCVIRFDRPIVGLIGAQSTLRATDASLGVPGMAYPTIKEGEKAPITGGAAGLDPKPYLDTATISADGRTLTLDIAAAQSLDQFRVLVQAKASEPEP